MVQDVNILIGSNAAPLSVNEAERTEKDSKIRKQYRGKSEKIMLSYWAKHKWKRPYARHAIGLIGVSAPHRLGGAD